MPSPFKFGRKKTAHPQQAVPPSVILQAIPTPSTSMPFPDQNSNESAVRPVAAPASTLSADSPSLISAEKKKAGMNFLKTLLNVVSKAPVLGIGVATEAILRIIKGLEDMRKVTASWKQLEDRMELLLGLLDAIETSQDLKNKELSPVKRQCRKLMEKLEELAAAIQKGDDQGSIAKFWNAADDKDSAEGFSNSLNEIMIDLMVAVQAETGVRRDEFEKSIRDSIEKLKVQTAKNGNVQSGVHVEVLDALIDKAGNIGSHNRGENVFVRVQGSVIGYVQDLGSHNIS